jgi:hypothetical protein
MKVYVENGKYICDTGRGLKKNDFASDGGIATNE